VLCPDNWPQRCTLVGANACRRPQDATGTPPRRGCPPRAGGCPCSPRTHLPGTPSTRRPTMGKKRKRQRPAGETFTLVDNGENLLEGLVLRRDAVTVAEEAELLTFINDGLARGRNGSIRKPTYLKAEGARSRGNRRESLQYGGFFDFNRGRPGKRGLVPPFPPILERLVANLVKRGFIDASLNPDSCIINSYAPGDCIPPHTDHAAYARPILTLSLLGEEPILVGRSFRSTRACAWEPIVGRSVTLPRRSLLLLGGNSGSVAKHCVSACAGPRVSITLRRQPPEDWRPDASELIGGETHKKRKPLSGSAKRRKKREKLLTRRTEPSRRT